MLAVIADCEYFVHEKVTRLFTYFSIIRDLQMEEAKKCIAELDVDQDGKVSYPEFILVWKYKKQQSDQGWMILEI